MSSSDDAWTGGHVTHSIEGNHKGCPYEMLAFIIHDEG